MRIAIGVDYRLFIAVGDRLDGRIQYGIYKLGIMLRADRPTHNETVEAVDHRRQVHLAGRDLEFGDAGRKICCRADFAVFAV
jgi:hypothetical protein